MKYEFAGISCNDKRAPKFDVLFDADGMYFSCSRKTYEHVDDDFSFKFKYCIKVDSEEDYDDPGKYKLYELNLLMVILPESLCDNITEQILDSRAEGESWKDEISIDLIYVVENGPCPIIGSELYYTRRELKHGIASAKRVIDAIDHLRGFYLDKRINMLGTTGWDIVRWWVGLQADIL